MPVRNKFYRISIPPHLIVLIQQMNLEKEFCDFLLFKHTYRDSKIHNYSIKGAAKKLNCSRTKIRRLVRIFLQQGWCEMDGLDLLFKNTKRIYYHITKVRPKTFTTLYLRVKNKQTIFQHFNLSLLKTKLNQIKAAIKVKDDLKFPETQKALKAAKRNYKKFPSILSPNDVSDNNDRCSLMGFAKLFSRHFTTVGKRIKLLRGLVAVTSNKRLLIKGCESNILSNEYSDYRNTFVFEGDLYKRLSNSYRVTFKPCIRSGKIIV